MVTNEKIVEIVEKKCLERLELFASYFDDESERRKILDVGRDMCSCVKSLATKHDLFDIQVVASEVIPGSLIAAGSLKKFQRKSKT